MCERMCECKLARYMCAIVHGVSMSLLTMKNYIAPFKGNYSGPLLSSS